MIKVMMDKNETVNAKNVFARNALEKFIFEYSDCDLSCVDEILLEYLVTVLESLGKDSNDAETSFDVDEFTKMMSEFIPGFENIDSACIISWMFSLAKRFETGTISVIPKKNLVKTSEDQKDIPKKDHVISSIPTTKNDVILPSLMLIQLPIHFETSKMDDSFNGLSDKPSKSPVKKLSYRDKLQKLQDLFPGTPEDQLSRALAHARGNLDKAVNTILSNKSCQERSLNNTNSSDEEEANIEIKEPCADPLMSEKVSQLQEVFPCMPISSIQEKLILVGNVEAASKLLLLEQEAKVQNASKFQVHKTSSKKANLSEEDLARLKRDALSKYSFVIEKSVPYEPIVFVEKDSRIVPLCSNEEHKLSTNECLKSHIQTLTEGKKSKANPKSYRKSRFR